MLVLEIYKLTNDFPKEEIYGLSQQMRRCAVSIPSNIAGGYGRQFSKEFMLRKFVILNEVQHFCKVLDEVKNLAFKNEILRLRLRMTLCVR